MPADLRFLAACAGLLGLGVGLLWAGGVIDRALDEAHDIFDEDDDATTAHGVPLITARHRGLRRAGMMR